MFWTTTGMREGSLRYIYRGDQISFSIMDEKERSCLAGCHMSLNNLLAKQIGGEPLQLKEHLISQGDLYLEIMLEGKSCEIKRINAVEMIYHSSGHFCMKVSFPQPAFCAQES